MKTGKLKESILKRSVLKQLNKGQENILVGPAVGIDYGAIDVKEQEVVVLSTDPVTMPVEGTGRLAVLAAANNVAVSGATPVGAVVHLLLPTSYNEETLRALMKDLNHACEECNISIINGHTEVTRAVKEALVTVTVVGTVAKEKLIHNEKMQAGMDLIISKWIGLEGTAILAMEKQEELRERFPQPFLDKAKAFSDAMSVLEEARVATNSGVCAMHDVSEGGVFGALWELAQCGNVGLEVDLKKIPIRQETIEICEFFDINPYKMLSGGSLLMVAEDGNQVVRELEKQGIYATVIGKITDDNDRVLFNGEERRFLEVSQTDELYKLLK